MPDVEYDKGLMYPFTIESLEAVVKGLDIQSSDRVLSVACSGDPIFAFLEYGCEVFAFDINKLADELKQEKN